MKIGSIQTAAASTTQSTNRRSEPNGNISIWIRLGLPAILALVAGWLNASVIANRLQPTEAFMLEEDVVPGVRLKPEHFKSVQIGGELDRDILLSRTELLVSSNPQSVFRSLKEAIENRPRVFSRFLSKGELLSDRCFGGDETLAADERRIYVPLSIIRGDHSKLLPGKFIFFDAIHRASHGENPKIEEIGPFRLAGSELKEMPNSKEDRQVALDYRLGPKGQIPVHAELLRAAVYSDGRIGLALIEKSLKQDGRDQVAVSTTSRP